MNPDLKNNLIKSLKAGVRYDGRKLDEFREINVETGVVANAEGSARVKMGDTEVIAGVKMMIEKPYPDTSDEGGLMIGAELLPLSSPDFESGPPGIQAIELARVVDRGIREAGAIDSKKLCIKQGEKAWFVSVDICSINDAGNLFDASALATLAAIKHARMPTYNEDTGAIDYSKITDQQVPMLKYPISITVIKIGNFFIVDPLPEEEAMMDARLSVASLSDGTICAMQKGGVVPIKAEDIKTMVSLAVRKAKELSKFI